MIAQRSSRPANRRRCRGPLCRACPWLLAASLAIAPGCGGPPQVGANNFKLVAGLRTAISARRTDWLEATARVVAERHASGELDDRQFQGLQSIIDQAHQGNWADAERDALRLAKAQR
jgi:hypothetical protein